MWNSDNSDCENPKMTPRTTIDFHQRLDFVRLLDSCCPDWKHTELVYSLSLDFSAKLAKRHWTSVTSKREEAVGLERSASLHDEAQVGGLRCLLPPPSAGSSVGTIQRWISFRERGVRKAADRGQ